MCQNIPTYHAVPDCGKGANNNIVSSQQNSALIMSSITQLGLTLFRRDANREQLE